MCHSGSRSGRQGGPQSLPHLTHLAIGNYLERVLVKVPRRRRYRLKESTSLGDHVKYHLTSCSARILPHFQSDQWDRIGRAAWRFLPMMGDRQSY
jgi:hypothetical protein